MPRKLALRRNRPGGRPPIVLDGEQAMELVKLHREQKSIRSIAKSLTKKFKKPISAQTVARLLRRAYADNADFALMLKMLRVNAFNSWQQALGVAAENGRATPAHDLFVATSTISEKKDAGPGLVIVVGDGKQVIGALPQIPADFGDAIEAETVRPDATRAPFDAPAVIHTTPHLPAGTNSVLYCDPPMIRDHAPTKKP
jgi:hypothetical protein